MFIRTFQDSNPGTTGHFPPEDGNHKQTLRLLIQHVTMSQNQEETTSIASIRMVIQRYRKASLLIDEKEVVTVGDGVGSADSSAEVLLGRDGSGGRGHVGMLVYISFSKTATPVEVQKAARTILNLPIQTEGAWGDGSSTKSILQAAGSVVDSNKEKPSAAPVSVMLVPQANLIAKVKKNGKSVQYRDQIDKTRGEELYDMFVRTVEGFLMEEHQRLTSSASSVGANNKSKAGNSKGNSDAVDPSIPPKELFRYRQKQQQEEDGSLLYGSFDESTGLPLTLASGEPLTKSASKRVKKLYDAHAKRHEKYLSKQQQEPPREPQSSGDSSTPAPSAGLVAASPATAQDAPTSATAKAEDKRSGLDPSFVRLIAGSFGKRQGLELVSDMGPFCHVIEL